MRVLCFGSLNYDNVYQVERFPFPGETMQSKSYALFSGGKGLNQSIALKKCGIDVYHAGQVGKDGDKLIRELHDQGVETCYINKTAGNTGHSVIQVEKGGQNSIILYDGANRSISEDWRDHVLSNFGANDLLVLQNEINGLDDLIRKAHAKGMKIVFNPAPFFANVLTFPLTWIDYLILNEIEAAGLTQCESLNESIEKLKGEYSNQHVIVTLGKRGSCYLYKQKMICTGIYDAPIVDTTTAGDTFVGYFIGEIVKGQDVRDALLTATKASALAISQKGASNSIPTIDQVREADLRYCEFEIAL